MPCSSFRLPDTDLLKGATHSPKGGCYAEAINLDGESSLKTRQPYDETRDMSEDAFTPSGCLVAEHWWLCRMLTMERLEGVPLTDLAAIRAVSSARDPEDILIGALNAWFGSVVACRRFHADVHAGTRSFMLTCMLVHEDSC